MNEPKQSTPLKLKILYEDNHLIAVLKPHRVLTQGDDTGDISLFDLAKSYLKERYQKPGNVFLGLLHRIDRPVAGIVLFAKTSKAASRISEQMRQRSFSKNYLAVVEGQVTPGEGNLTHYLEFDESKRNTEVYEENNGHRDKAILHFRSVHKSKVTSCLAINLETGRKHQIRSQLAFIRHPIVGDRKYGAKNTYFYGAIALLATKIEFMHPTEKKLITIELKPEDYPNREWWSKHCG